MQVLRNHGIYKNLKIKQNWRFDQRELGYNFRITDIHSALGISQLKRIKSFINKRKKICLLYDKYFKKNPKYLSFRIKKRQQRHIIFMLVKLSSKKEGLEINY